MPESIGYAASLDEDAGAAQLRRQLTDLAARTRRRALPAVCSACGFRDSTASGRSCPRHSVSTRRPPK
jgi:hypothetical protein